MEKDYKIEMKGSLWEVILSSGAYSDYREKHLVFSGNSEDEIWNFLKRYIDDISEETDYQDTNLFLKCNGETYISKKYIGDREDISWDSDYDASNVSIKRLNVIYFKQ